MPQLILAHLGRSDYRPASTLELRQLLRLKNSDSIRLASTLDELELAGKIVRVRKDRWVLPQEAELVTGVLQFNNRGFAFLIPETGDEDFFIAAEDTGTALHQDLVVARKVRGQKNVRFNNPQAQVIRILKRRRQSMVGQLEKSGHFYQVIPDDPRFIHNIYVPDPRQSELRPLPELGDKVVVQLSEWKDRHHNPEGVIVERLGRPGDPGVDILAIIRKCELPTEFPGEALAEVASFAHPEGDATFDDTRVDLREEFIFTIDPETAKDFDDAIHIKSLGGGRWEVGIHIADVSYYVRPDSALDHEARKRGNSVYLVNQVIPMLPEELSNGLCSLNPHVDRLTYSAIATVTEDGRILNHHTTKSVIHSKHRLSYEQVFERLQRKPQDDLDRTLHQAWKIASRLRSNRFAAGSLDLDMPEVKVHCDEHGKPIKLTKVEHDASHQLIEEFMLLANELVARDLRRKQLPAVFRVHESPDAEKLAEYRELLKIHNIKIGDLTQKKEVQRALQLIQGRPETHALKVGLLRSLKRAVYSAKPEGHYGLGKEDYTHFTSPIRRYADLIVHRAIAGIRMGGTAEMERIAQHISQTERNAADAEGESVKLKKFEFFQNQLVAGTPQSFPAVVMDVQNFGMFVELPDFLISGLVHVSGMDDDFYHYNDRQKSLEGKRSRRSYSIGDSVEVQVLKVDMAKQQIDFKLAGSQTPSSNRQSSSRPSSERPSERRPEQAPARSSRQDRPAKTSQERPRHKRNSSPVPSKSKPDSRSKPASESKTNSNQARSSSRRRRHR
ncbi:MAG: ribonuclease R [Blastochloris sp.]|nr:ribonuclease R [Blastochloris sp.]